MSLHACDRLILAGPSEATRALSRLLPKRLSGCVVGSLPLPIHSMPEDIVEATIVAQRAVEREGEIQLVEDLIVSAAKSVEAVTGLGATLLASNNGEIWKLVYAQDSSVPGKSCRLCDRLFEANRFSCGHCNTPLFPVDDLIEVMIERQIKNGQRIEHVRGEAAQKLKESGGIGAFLRLGKQRRCRSASKPK